MLSRESDVARVRAENARARLHSGVRARRIGALDGHARAKAAKAAVRSLDAPRHPRAPRHTPRHTPVTERRRASDTGTADRAHDERK